MLIVPGAAGEIGILARHAPLIATLKAGSTRVYLNVDSEEVREYATGPGFFKVELDRAIALVDDAVLANEIDDTRARASSISFERTASSTSAIARSSCTWKKPGHVAYSRTSCAARSRYTRVEPAFSVAIRGACRASTPISPAAPGTTIISASPSNAGPSGVTSETSNFFVSSATTRRLPARLPARLRPRPRSPPPQRSPPPPRPRPCGPSRPRSRSCRPCRRPARGDRRACRR